MHTFELKRIRLVTGERERFYQLIVDGINQRIEFFEENVKGNNQLESEFYQILQWMDEKSIGNPLPPKKMKPVRGGKDEYEFRTEHLRIYAFQLTGTGKIVTYWTLKKPTQQDRDIQRFRNLKNGYLNSIK